MRFHDRFRSAKFMQFAGPETYLKIFGILDWLEIENKNIKSAAWCLVLVSVC